MSRVIENRFRTFGVFAVTLILAIADVHADNASGIINVAGSAERRLQPDSAQIDIAIEIRHAQLNEARRQVGARTVAVLQLLDSVGIPNADVDSSALSVQPEFSWDTKSSERRLQGYLVVRTIRVRLLDLEKLGSILERSVRAGANQISPPRFTLQNEAHYRRELLVEATRDAKQNAAAIAEGLGLKLGDPRRIEAVDSETPGYAAPVMLRASAAAADGAAIEESYKPGELTLRVRVKASFDIAP